MHLRWQTLDAIWPGLLGGLLSGLVGALVFAAAHAVLIVPIWSRMGSGLVFGALAGAAAGWAFIENYPAHASSSAKEAIAIGASFGASLWLLVVPVSAADAFLRAVGIAPRLELVAVGVAVVLAVGAGAALGWHRTRRRRGIISGAAATLALTVAMAGPVPIARSPRAFGIFLAVLPASAIAGGVLALVTRRLHYRRDRSRITTPPVSPAT